MCSLFTFLRPIQRILSILIIIPVSGAINFRTRPKQSAGLSLEALVEEAIGEIVLAHCQFWVRFAQDVGLNLDTLFKIRLGLGIVAKLLANDVRVYKCVCVCVCVSCTPIEQCVRNKDILGT